MKIREIILEKIPKEEVEKLNVMLFFLRTSAPSTNHKVYDRVKAKSSFYNCEDISTGGFYKHTSLIIGPVYEKK